jgi:uncharacterized protein (TIGR03435 family)
MLNYCGMGRARSNGSLMVADWYGVSMAELAGRMLTSAVDLPVVDKTGLTQRFDVHIQYFPDRHTTGPVTLNGVVTDLPAAAAVAWHSIRGVSFPDQGLQLVDT